VINGLFGVKKDEDKIRLIVDARPANSLFVDSPSVSLPTPDLLAKLSVPIGVPFYTAKVDLDNFYHRLRLPVGLRKYFALPAVRAADISPEVAAEHGADTLVWPCCTTLPMGFSHSVYLAQTAHEHQLNEQSTLRPEDRVTERNDVLINRTRHLCYIDDLIMVDIDERRLALRQAEYIAGIEPTGLIVKQSKVQRPTTEPVECLGLQVHGAARTIGLAPLRLRKLCAATLALIDRRACTGLDMQELLGSWVWALLPCRPALATLNACFRFAECAGRRVFTIWRSVRAELEVLVGLQPLLLTHLDSPWSPTAAATDASEWGLGVCFRPTHPTLQQSCSRLAGLLPLPSALEAAVDRSPVLDLAADRPSWQRAISASWKRSGEHINALELRAVVTCVKRALSEAQTTCRRLLVLADSTVTVGSLVKGRSSSPVLLRRLRSVAALLLASGMRLTVCWLPSAANPADDASRGR
jgi:hypothetical protein